MADRVGQQFGDYRLKRLLGRGNFADVYLGEHVRKQTQVAVKVLKERLAPDTIKDFINEARTIRLRHPHIIEILDFGLHDDHPYLIMPYLFAGSLRGHLPRGIPVPLPRVVSHTKQVADALQYAHDENVIHRDIKPENMLLDERGQVVLSDFGIATITQSSHYQQTDSIAGTAAYMAPEQWQGKPRPASDQYSLGVVVYEWLCGERPFPGPGVLQYGFQHVNNAPPPLRDKVPTISPEVEQVVLTALAKDPKDRFASMRAFATALEQASRPAPPPVRPPAPITPKPQLATPYGQVQPSAQPAPSWQNAPTWVTPQQPASSPMHLPKPASPAQPEPVTDPIPHLRRTIQGEPPPPFSTSPPRPGVPLAPAPVLPPAKHRWARGLLAGVMVLVLLSGSLVGVGFAGKGPLAFLGKPTLGTIKEFGLSGYGSRPFGITKGPDGNLWFTEFDGNQIGRITPVGKITEFALPTGSSSPTDIVNGPDGSLWFTEGRYIQGIGGEVTGNRIGRITPGDLINEFPLPSANSDPYGITAGSDGNLWFTEFSGNQIGRITPGGKITEFALPTANSYPFDITTGQDGSLWFTERDSNQIGRITSMGKITEFAIPTVGDYPFGITAGPDGNLWFDEIGGKIGRITPAGQIIEFSVPTSNSGPLDLTSGPDGNLWFTESDGNKIGRITPAGQITEFGLPTANSGPHEITAGPDGNLWFTESNGNKIGWINPGP